MRDQIDEFNRLSVNIVVVTFENDFFARSYVAETDLDWPLLIDSARDLYMAYDMLQASFLDLWGLKSWQVYLRELLKGQKLHMATNDIHQRGGDIVIDPDGIIRLHHVGNGPADRPSVERILQIIRNSLHP